MVSIEIVYGYKEGGWEREREREGSGGGGSLYSVFEKKVFCVIIYFYFSKYTYVKFCFPERNYSSIYTRCNIIIIYLGKVRWKIWHKFLLSDRII